MAIGLAWITIVGGVLLTTIWLYVFPLMVDRGMGFWESLGASYRMVVDGGFWEHLALVLDLAPAAYLPLPVVAYDAAHVGFRPLVHHFIHDLA